MRNLVEKLWEKQVSSHCLTVMTSGDSRILGHHAARPTGQKPGSTPGRRVTQSAGECNAMLNKRHEPIPASAISLSAAFQKFIEHRFENLRELERKADLTQTEALKEYDEALRHAELSFREWLNADGPSAYVLDPVTGEWRRIDKRGWTSNLPRTLTLQEDSSIVSGPPGNFLPGFYEDFVSPYDMFSHGPSDAQFDGILQKVFFNENECEGKLTEASSDNCSSKPPRKLKKLKLAVPSKPGPRRSARLVLDALHPDGIPIDLSGKQLHQAVNRWLRKHPAHFVEGRTRETISLDTVLRAAERKS
jgi:hypothetical protein